MSLTEKQVEGLAAVGEKMKMSPADHYEAAMSHMVVAVHCDTEIDQRVNLDIATLHAHLGELAFKLGHAGKTERPVGFQ